MTKEPHSTVNCWCGYDHPEIRPRAVATERGPAYAGHQAHPCPVCLNVHGGAPTPCVHDGWPEPPDHLHSAMGPCTYQGCTCPALLVVDDVTERSAT